MVEPSNAERNKVLKYIIKSSHFGEVNEVFNGILSYNNDN